MKQDKSRTTWLLIIGGLLLSSVIFTNLANSLENSGKTEEQIKKERLYDTAVLNAQLLVKRKLKAPSTAVFPTSSEATVKDLGNNTYLIESYVDSENSYGAMLRKNWVATIIYEDNNKVSLKELTFK